ncbi:iron dicitrate transport regulator FecR [Bacillus thuringiensis serovar pingluonsis]|jgi:DNA-binding MurR/RpiR family transcriptional regulator|nr:SIS domain protein [Bacillus anthracis str. CDC 684]AHE83669.1 iron dicitrate transport regulator FecR [Bacillus anthracis str. A16R]AHE89563.1 iron dicitrate transport regulator FecR [Bacillus anthracis str. A16]AIF56490.1 iron dicitrate transport regulator FecR [Bacillus anthracis]AIK62476.1 putative sIS domain protein [Bacillus anthracis str. Vollum]AJG50900.1 putative sIS domain protein [Bacillus anthracis str. Turkey32]AJG75734.1 putative sIS domain protein [Bacillus thuringiensis]AJ
MNNCVTLHLLNDTALEQAVKALQEANRIEFYGNGGSGIIATDA